MYLTWCRILQHDEWFIRRARLQAVWDSSRCDSNGVGINLCQGTSLVDGCYHDTGSLRCHRDRGSTSNHSSAPESPSRRLLDDSDQRSSVHCGKRTGCKIIGVSSLVLPGLTLGLSLISGGVSRIVVSLYGRSYAKQAMEESGLLGAEAAVAPTI